MSLDLDKIEALARETGPYGSNGKGVPWTDYRIRDDACAYQIDVHGKPNLDYMLGMTPHLALEMIALIRRQEKELIEARERRSEPSAVRVTIVDERAAPLVCVGDTGYRHPDVNMVRLRLKQIANPVPPFHGIKWAAADALYWLTGDQAFADQADGLAAESLGLRQTLVEMEARKDAAYLERNQVVAALAKCFPSGVARTAIEDWSEDWHGCVYIDLPTGQASWHFHDSQAYLFDGLPPYAGTWDGHDTPEKYRRLAALDRAKQ